MSKRTYIPEKNPDWCAEIPSPSVAQHIDLENIYTVANDELSLQQKKRDQIITLYLAMITFFVPFTIELEALPAVKGCMFLFLSVIGSLLGLIVIRYRVYKEIYWISLRAIAQLKNYEDSQINKSLIQSLYFNSLYKKAAKYANKDKKKVKIFLLAKSVIFSAETLYFILQSFVSSAIFAVSVFFIFSSVSIPIRFAISIVLGIALFVFQYFTYIRALAKVYEVAARPDDKKAFNYCFSKAWHLHIYQTK